MTIQEIIAWVVLILAFIPAFITTILGVLQMTIGWGFDSDIEELLRSIRKIFKRKE